MQPELVGGGWYNYRFRTRLQCALNCPPGAHPLYEGKTNRPWERVLEHAKTQQWFPHACGYDIYPEVYATERESLAAEAERIRANLPLANRALNEGNRHRLDFGDKVVAPRRTAARRAGAPSRPATRPQARGRRWSRRRRRVVAWPVAWAVLAAVLWFAACARLDVAVWDGARAGGLGSTGALAGVWLVARSSRRTKRRAVAWLAVGCAAAVLWLLWPFVGAHLGVAAAA